MCMFAIYCLSLEPLPHLLNFLTEYMNSFSIGIFNKKDSSFALHRPASLSKAMQCTVVYGLNPGFISSFLGASAHFSRATISLSVKWG